ncbi:MAG: NADPH-dependent curcumin reductase CurA [Saprospiraceae bacterium]|jgi:NADPH-dependent curcumin reductase CurA|tara:strand:- start:268 stop:1281 length:1014 start_codon:yes stop_codon:yes gene_type:complete
MSEDNRVWRLRNRPTGNITDETLSLENENIPEPKDGECLFRLNYLSLDPTNRIWMSDQVQYMPPVAIGDPMRGVVCGTVLKSKSTAFKEGDVVSGIGSWSDFQIGTPESVGLLGEVGTTSIMDAFATLALVGPSAYFCLLDIGVPKAGETVVVSAAAGAVGSIVGQIAKIKGCHVVGLAGSDEKCRWIKKELGFDEAINYKTENIPEALAHACPKGIDIYFDNVGGAILDECLKLMNLYGRIPTCGLISQYNSTEPVPGPYNYGLILMHRLKIQGFIILDYLDRFAEANAAIIKWMSEGKIKIRLDVSDGLESAVKSVKKLYTGENTGKLIVRVKDV